MSNLAHLYSGSKGTISQDFYKLFFSSEEPSRIITISRFECNFKFAEISKFKGEPAIQQN
jgi:hypothetical protein